MFDVKVIQMLLEGIKDTLYMTIVSTVVGYALGLPLGILLYVSSDKGLKPNAVLYRIGDFVCNIIRSIPFLILLIPSTIFTCSALFLNSIYPTIPSKTVRTSPKTTLKTPIFSSMGRARTRIHITLESKNMQ